METQTAFGLGMLVVIAIAIIIAVVIGMLKVIYLEEELTNLRTNTDRYLANIERYLSEVRRELDQRIDHTQSMMDSRFDKFENKITKKQILKD